jgi:hypothetical protein
MTLGNAAAARIWLIVWREPLFHAVLRKVIRQQAFALSRSFRKQGARLNGSGWGAE